MNWISTIWQESISLSLQRRKQLQFAALIVLLSALVLYRIYGYSTPAYWGAAIAGGVGALIVVLPKTIFPVLLIWFFVGKFIGEIVSGILLAIIYFTFIWLMRFFVSSLPKGGWTKHNNDENDYTKMG